MHYLDRVMDHIDFVQNLLKGVSFETCQTMLVVLVSIHVEIIAVYKPYSKQKMVDLKEDGYRHLL